MLFGVLIRKTQTCYIKFLQEISKHLYVHPISISIDFKKAFINAISHVFPETIIYLCYFHFKSSMWRRITDEGLRNAYVNNEATRKILKLPQVLAFVPIDDVVIIFKKIKLDCANFEDDRIVQFYEYFEDNYVGKELQVEEESRGRNNRKSPSFKKNERSVVSNKYVECKFAS